MGIKGLTKFIGDNAPKAMKQQDFNSLMGRIVAIDASMSLYQFMVAIRDAETFGTLTNEAGEATSHISGMLSRAVRLLEYGIKPVYVFDGKPPRLKGGELAKRSQKRAEAEQDLAEAKEAGEKEEIKKFMGRTVRITKQHNEDVKQLLRLMGIPLVEAPCEAEAQCAHLCRDGLVYATATEDADALTFGSSVLIRHLNFSDAKTKGTANPLLVINHKTLLEELDMTSEQFVDFCILCGCDYCDTIKGIGASSAFKLIKSNGSLEKVLESLDKTKYPVPDNFPYKDAREFFMDPEIQATSDIKLEWTEPDWEGLKTFLVDENSFNATRIDNYIARLRKARGKASQTRLENFFGATSVKQSSLKPAPQPKGKAKAKAKATGAGVKRKSVAAGGKENEADDGGSLLAAAAASQNNKRVKMGG